MGGTLVLSEGGFLWLPRPFRPRLDAMPAERRLPESGPGSGQVSPRSYSFSPTSRAARRCADRGRAADGAAGRRARKARPQARRDRLLRASQPHARVIGTACRAGLARATRSAVKPPSGGPLPAIRRLPPGLVNRIAAGEVVERPASAVKELVENALDAGATRITVELAEGGRSLIAVTDDGAGMAPRGARARGRAACDLQAAGRRSGADHDLGFRGEALAALAGVSRMRITSRPPGQESAFALAVVAGDAGPAGAGAGRRRHPRRGPRPVLRDALPGSSS